MKIAHVTATFPPDFTGTGMVCFNNATELASLGHNVTVFTANFPIGEYKYPKSIEVRHVPYLFRFGNAPFLLKLASLERFDIIHLHHPFIFGSELIWLNSKLKRTPFIITHHNDLIASGVKGKIFNAYDFISSRIVLKGAKKFIVVSLDHAKNGKLSSFINDHNSRVMEIPNGVDINKFRPSLDKNLVRKKYGIPDNSIVLLFVGVLDKAHHYRRVDLLIKAVNELHNPNIHLIIVGEGDQRSAYQDLAMNLEINSHVHFLGKIINGELPLIYAASNIVILPSFIQEAFPLVLLEAMACAKPIIASDLPGVRTMVEDMNGLLVQPGDLDDLVLKIQYLIDNPHLRDVFGANGRRIVEKKYSWTAIAKQLERIYWEVLNAQ